MTNDGNSEMWKMPSENFSLCINELRAQSAFSSNLTCIFPRVVSAIKIFVVTLQSENKSKAYAIPHQIPTKSHLYSVAIREMQGSITNYHY